MLLKKNSLIFFVVFAFLAFLGNVNNVSAQTFCGDGIIQTPNDTGTGGPLNDGNEDCDIVCGATCVSKGYSSGALACDNSNCTFDTSNCCTRNDPVVTIAPASASGFASEVQTYLLSVKNEDTASCADRTFALALSGLPPCLPGGWVDDLEVNTGSLAGQAIYTKAVDISSCLTILDGTYTFTITATEGINSGNDSADYVIDSPDIEDFKGRLEIARNQAAFRAGKKPSLDELRK